MKGLGNVRERVWSCSLRFLSEAKGPCDFAGSLCFVRPAGRTHSEVKVLYWPDRGNS